MGQQGNAVSILKIVFFRKVLQPSFPSFLIKNLSHTNNVAYSFLASSAGRENDKDVLSLSDKLKSKQEKFAVCNCGH